MVPKLFVGLATSGLLLSLVGVTTANDGRANRNASILKPVSSSTPCATPTAGISVSTATSIAPSATTTAGQNLMAARVAAKYCVSVVEVQTWHAQGFGYGEIGKAYALAAAAGVSVDTLLTRHGAGEGWGKIAASLGFKAMGGGVNVRVISLTTTSQATAVGTAAVFPTTQGIGSGNQGQGNGNNGNGNQGQGNGNNGNGNQGLGNGNNGNGNQGQGNGNGNNGGRGGGRP